MFPFIFEQNVIIKLTIKIGLYDFCDVSEKTYGICVYFRPDRYIRSNQFYLIAAQFKVVSIKL